MPLKRLIFTLNQCTTVSSILLGSIAVGVLSVEGMCLAIVMISDASSLKDSGLVFTVSSVFVFPASSSSTMSLHELTEIARSTDAECNPEYEQIIDVLL